jgi:ribosomal protein S15P/S13E
MAKVYVCFMVGKTELSNVRAMLTGIRLQIELLQKAVEQNPQDKESRKRLREAKAQENVILAKLREWTLH